jgi:hypothetical protein
VIGRIAAGEVLRQKISKTTKQLGVVMCACHPSYAGSKNRRITVQACLDMSTRPYLKNNKSKKDWRYGSSGRVLAQQVQGLSSNSVLQNK